MNQVQSKESIQVKAGRGLGILQQELERALPGVKERVEARVPSLEGKPALAIAFLILAVSSVGLGLGVFSWLLGGEEPGSRVATSEVDEGAAAGSGAVAEGEVDYFDESLYGTPDDPILQLEGREKLAMAIERERRSGPAVFGSRVLMRAGGKRVAALETTGRFRDDDAGSGRIEADGVIRLGGKRVGQVDANWCVVDGAGRRAGRLESDGTLRDAKGRKVGSISDDGTVVAGGRTVARFEGVSWSDCRYLAGYLLLVHPLW